MHFFSDRAVKIASAAAAALLFAASPLVRAGEEIKLSIGKTAMSNVFAKIKEPFEKETGIRINSIGADPKGSGGDQVFMDVDRGLAEGGAGGLPWEKWLELMKEKKYTVQTKLGEFRHQTIGVDRIQIMTYSGGPKSLNAQQIAKLLSGEVRNWKDVGGQDQKVQVLLNYTKQPSTVKYLEEKIMGGKRLTQDLKIIGGEKDDPLEMARKIGATPGAIGFGPELSVDSTVKVNIPVHPVMGRPLVFIFKGTPSKNLALLLRFIKEKGTQFGIAH